MILTEKEVWLFSLTNVHFDWFMEEWIQRALLEAHSHLNFTEIIQVKDDVIAFMQEEMWRGKIQEALRI